MVSRKHPDLEIRSLRKDDLERVVELQFYSWHEYYQQYSIYDLIKDSVTRDSLRAGWQPFLGAGSAEGSRLVIGAERRAFVAVLAKEIVGVGAASSYVEGKWPVVDSLLKDSQGRIEKTAKFQELYILPELRSHGLGRRLSLVRAEIMLDLGYKALFLTTYAEAEKTNQYHLKNGLEKVHEYMSIEKFKDEKRVKIACFLHRDLEKYRNSLKAKLDDAGHSA